MLPLYLVVTAVTAATIGLFLGRRVQLRNVARPIACFLTHRGMKNLPEIAGLGEFLRPDDVKEVTTPAGFKLIAVASNIDCIMSRVNDLNLRHDDVFVVTYPKAGTTWMQEIAWLICNNVDIESARKVNVARRIPFIEFHDPYTGPLIDKCIAWPRGKQRLMKSHLPYETLPREARKGGKCKIIYVARNPKDVCVSFYFFHLMNQFLPKAGSWDEFFRKFISGKVVIGSWFPHVLTFWKRYKSGDERIFFTTYEDMQKDLKSVVVSLAKFLDKDLSESQKDALVNHCSFESMKANDSVNYKVAFPKLPFMRKGKVGDWKNYFTLNQNAEFDALYEAEMNGSGLNMTFDLCKND